MFDYSGLFRDGLPDPAPRWTPFPKYYFIGGNNDPEQIPVEGLIEATPEGRISLTVRGRLVADAIGAEILEAFETPAKVAVK